LGLSGIVLLVAAGVGALAGGGVAAAGAAGGVALVAVSYTISTLAIAWADSIAPRMVLGVGVGTYILKFTLLGALLVALTDAGWAGRIPMAWGIVAGVIAWTASQIWWTVHHAHPYVSASENQ
jgi:hypothetical protein